jgi:membrane protease YdiL (CAAX protease family)
MRIALFLVLTALLSTPSWYLSRLGGNPLYMYALMWAPGLGAMLSIRLTGGSMTMLGLQPTHAKWLLLAWLSQIGLAAALTGGLLATGIVEFPNPTFVAEQTEKLRLPAGSSAGVVTTWYVLLKATFGIVGTGASALGEEIGWRGFLTVETHRRWGFTASSLFVGVIWAVWHLPLSQNEPIARMAAFVVAVTASSLVYAWFRLASGSVWPAMILHATHNAVLELHAKVLVAPPEGSPRSIWIGEDGVGFAILAVVVAAGFWRYRERAVRRA